jgi:hypothetical protein
MIRVTVTLICLSCAVPASAQDAGGPFRNSSPPSPGGTIPNRAVASPTFGPRAGTEILRHRDFAGKPCLAISGQSRSHVINPKVYDHVIIVSNACPQRIVIRVCYYRTQDCIPMEISGGERKEARLGSMPSVNGFDFEFRERF